MGVFPEFSLSGTQQYLGHTLAQQILAMLPSNTLTTKHIYPFKCYGTYTTYHACSKCWGHH